MAGNMMIYLTDKQRALIEHVYENHMVEFDIWSKVNKDLLMIWFDTCLSDDWGIVEALQQFAYHIASEFMKYKSKMRGGNIWAKLSNS